jgi:RimJ/RimL family protein N-acetyltransferase
MTTHTNDLGQPIGFDIPDWSARSRPPRSIILGKSCRIEPLDADKHSNNLYQAFGSDTDHHNWTYLPYGPFESFEVFDKWLRGMQVSDDPMFHTVIDVKTEQAMGVASYMRIDPTPGVIEVGHIHFSPLLQQTTLSTEAMFLMMRRVFNELGYRRYEWKCDSLNGPSCRAAKRLGFVFEGTFRQATIYKGRNRDTSWFAILDKDWPSIRQAYESWFDPENFDTDGKQVQSLSYFMR